MLQHSGDRDVLPVFQVPRCPLPVYRLALKVELRLDGLFKVAHDPLEVETPRLDLVTHHAEHCEVGREILAQPRVYDLDGDVGSVGEAAAVNLV